MMERVASGSPELDQVLDGGFPANSINVIMGLPGTGKTILAEKVLFTNATAERPGLCVGTVSEPLDKMLRYLQGFDYFDADAIGESVHFEDLSGVLRTDGLRGFVDRLVQLLKELRPAYLVVDSFKALHSFADSAMDFRVAISELMTVLSALPVTSFLIGEYRSDEIGVLPEFAIADGIVELILQKVGVKDARYIRVVKQRGSSFFEGEHAFKITRAGLEVFPRLVTPAAPISYDLVRSREKTGIPLLDEMVSQGWWRGGATVVFGPPGSGKTLLGLHYIFKGIEMGEKGLIATLEENPTQLAAVAKGFGWDLPKAIEDGMLELVYVSPVDVYIDEFIHRITRTAIETGVRRMMIDSLNDLAAASPSGLRFREYSYALVQNLSAHGVSLYMTSEVSDLFSTTVVTEYGISHMSDNVVLLHYVRYEGSVKRAISIVKTRASSHDPHIRLFDISSEGIVLGSPVPGDIHFPGR